MAARRGCRRAEGCGRVRAARASRRRGATIAFQAIARSSRAERHARPRARILREILTYAAPRSPSPTDARDSFGLRGVACSRVVRRCSVRRSSPRSRRRLRALGRPFVEIASPGPLTERRGRQRARLPGLVRGRYALRAVPAVGKPGDCGTLVVHRRHALRAELRARTPLRPAARSASARRGRRSASRPSVDRGRRRARSRSRPSPTQPRPACARREVDTYVAGQESYRTDVTLTNSGGAPATGVIYRAGDCYLQESDTGFGFLDAATRRSAARRTPTTRRPDGSSSGTRSRRATSTWRAATATCGRRSPHTPRSRTRRARRSRSTTAPASAGTSRAPPGGQSTFSHYTTFSAARHRGPAAHDHPGDAEHGVRAQRDPRPALEPRLRQPPLLQDQAAQEVLADDRRRHDQDAAHDARPARHGRGARSSICAACQGSDHRQDHRADDDRPHDQGHAQVQDLPREAPRRQPS